MSQHERSITTSDGMTISTKFYPPLEPVDQPLPDNVILLDNNDNVFNYDRDHMTSSWSAHSNWSSIQQDDGRASSLDSWGEDEFDRQAARRVLDMFADIDLALYEGKRLDNALLDAECADWRALFPHFRLTGRRIGPQSRSITPHRPPSVTLATSRNRKKKKKAKLRSSLPSASKQAEEVFAQHGTLDVCENDGQSSSKLRSSYGRESDNLRAAVVQELTARNLWPNVMTCVSPLINSYKAETPAANRSSPLRSPKRHVLQQPLVPAKPSNHARRHTQTNVVTILPTHKLPVTFRRVQSLGAPKQRSARQLIPSNSRMISAVKIQPRKYRPIGVTANARNQTTAKSWSRLPPIENGRPLNIAAQPRPASAHAGRVQFKMLAKKERSLTFDEFGATDDAVQIASEEVPSTTASSKSSRSRKSRRDTLRDIPKHTAQRASSKAARKNAVRASASASPIKRPFAARTKSPFRI